MLLPDLEKLNHAIVITGNRFVNLKHLKQELVGKEVFIFDHESLKIDTLRNEIIPLLTTRKLSNQRFVIIATDHFGFEAQNAFLKNLEEPQQGTHIILLVADEQKLLPTILSRVQIIQGEQELGTSRLDVSEFLKKNLADKFTYIETWTKAKKDEDTVSKTEVLHFIDALEHELWHQGNRDEQLFADIRKVRTYAAIRGSSHRILLDFLAIML